MHTTESQMDLAERLRKVSDARIAAAAASVLEPPASIPSAEMATDLANIIGRMALDERVGDAQAAAMILNKFVPHLQELAMDLEREHQAGPMAARIVRGVIEAVGTCALQINDCARQWMLESK